MSAHLLDLLLNQDADWSALTWRQHFRTIRAGLATSTHRTYAAMKHFTCFCVNYTVQTPFLVHELLLCYFAAYLAQKGLAPQTVKGYLAAVRSAQISMSLPDLRELSSLPLLRRVLAESGFSQRGRWLGQSPSISSRGFMTLG